MGKRGRKGSRGRGSGAGGANLAWRERTNKAEVDRHNDRYEKYYEELGIVPEDERDELWEAMRRDLPNSFRFTGSKGHALAVQQRLKDFYIPKITTIVHDGGIVEQPMPINWYPDQLAWYMTTPKHIIRRFPPFASFQKFLVAETEVGNISRQEVVSMIPPLCMDIKPGMTVLDMCAAPGSKSAQLIEMVHGGEEERSRSVAEGFENGMDRSVDGDYEDDGRSTGLLIANDVDYKRAHMLVHQMKRLTSPNLIVTNHDATLYPSIKLSSRPSASSKSLPNQYLKFDRILADVPCSGDGTCRKNLEIWRKWNPGNALGLHAIQVRILVRALQMLKVGGRVVYSTCSMSPVEDEAVLATAIERCGGSDKIAIVDSTNYLPGLKRYEGMRSWKIMDKSGRIWSSYEELMRQRERQPSEVLERLQETMFPPKNDLHLERCMRVYPHLQDTGAFFIAILEKKTEIKAKGVAEKLKLSRAEAVGLGEVKRSETNGVDASCDPLDAEDVPSAALHQPNQVLMKRKMEDDREANEIDQESSKRSKAGGSEYDIGRPHPRIQERHVDALATTKSEFDRTANLEQEFQQPNVSTLSPSSIPVRDVSATADLPVTDGYKLKKSGRSFEEPFKYLDTSLEELNWIKKFYCISPRFPCDRLMVRNASGVATKNVYYTTELAKSILQANEGQGMKFVHSGVKMFVKQDVTRAEVCPWRIQTDGLAILEPWLGPERRVRLWKRQTLRKLLIEMFPRFSGDEWKNLGEIGSRIKEISMGCCVLQIEPSEDQDGFSERMVFPLWKSLHSLNLMLPKEDRRALLLRLFNDETPLVNLSSRNSNSTVPKAPVPVEPGNEIEEVERRRNSSSDEEAVV